MADAALLHMKIHIGRHDISVVAAQMANIVGLINAWLVLCKCKRMAAFHLIINNIPNKHTTYYILVDAILNKWPRPII